MSQGVKADLIAFELKVRRKEIGNSHQIAEEIVKLIKKAIKPLTRPSEVDKTIRFISDRLKKHFPYDVIIKNICELIISSLEEEIRIATPKRNSKAITRSGSICFIDYLNVPSPEIKAEDGPTSEDLKNQMMDVLENLSANLSRAYMSIADDASDFVHAKDIVLTIGYSNSVLNFLSNENLGATVIIPERAPEYDGIIMASKLKSKGVPVIVIPDSAIFAIIPKVNMIILSANAVFANGGIMSFSLSYAIALAARHYSKPLLVLYWEMKLTKEVYHPAENSVALRQPSQVMEKDSPTHSNVTAINPDGDYIPPEFITLMINENGTHCPGDVFSMVQATYFFDSRK